MIIKNREKLISNSISSFYKKLRSECLDVLEFVLECIDPIKLIKNQIKIDGSLLKINNVFYNLDNYDRIFVLGGGKAGDTMALAIEKIIGERITKGIINVPYERSKNCELNKIFLIGASHPKPDSNSVYGVTLMLDAISNITERDLIIFLISGGASSLITLPVEDITLEDYQDIIDILLKKGVNIEDLNIVRKHLDKIKGGKILEYCYPAEVLSIILSDVIGDKLSTIGSGLTIEDTSKFEDAIKILKKYDVWNKTPVNIKTHLINGESNEKPKETITTSKYFKRVQNFIVGNNNTALESALVKSKLLGFNSLIIPRNISGESRKIGKSFSPIINEIILHDKPIKKPAAIIAGGETTVNVKGKGIGGRNQELVLSMIKEINGLPCVIASIGTDGIDGNSNAAGAIIDGETVKKALTLNMNFSDFLKKNDSNTFFQKINDAIITGYTGTNVNDIVVILIGLDNYASY
ncbi:glycerate kinase [Candidatus Bathyarchaeota archaeon]|nr:glycerate kinase [Candidatus Bathyarchaeota archaeon]